MARLPTRRQTVISNGPALLTAGWDASASIDISKELADRSYFLFNGAHLTFRKYHLFNLVIRDCGCHLATILPYITVGCDFQELSTNAGYDTGLVDEWRAGLL